MTNVRRVGNPDERSRRHAVSVALILLMWLAVPAIAFGLAALVLKLSDSVGYSLLIAYCWVVVAVAGLAKIFNRRAFSQADFISPRDGEKPPMAGEKVLVAIALVGFLLLLVAMGTSDSY